MDLLANYNDDSLNLEDSLSADTEKKESKKVADTSLEDEWLSFEKMISGQKPAGETNSQYLIHGMVAYPGMSLASKQVPSATVVETKQNSDDSSEEAEKDDHTSDQEEKDDVGDDDDDDDAFFKMRKRVKERDRSSSSDRSSKSSDSSRSGSLSPPQLSPVHSENSQHSLPPPDLLDPSQDGYYKSQEPSPAESPEQSPKDSPAASPKEEEEADVAEEQPESVADSQIVETESKSRSKSKERKLSRDSKSSRKDSHRSRSRSKHKESKRHRSRSRSKSRRHRHSSKDRHRHRRHRSRDRKRSRSKDKQSKSEEKKSENASVKSRDRIRNKSKERKRSRSKGRDRKKSDKDRRRSKSKERRQRDRSSDRKRRHSKSGSRSRDRKRRYSRSRSRSRERLRSRSPVLLGKKMTFKEIMRKEILTAGKKADKDGAETTSVPLTSPGEMLKASTILASIKSTNASVTPQMALLQTMAAMHQKAQEITGVAVPKYYNPAAVNPLKYAEQVQKRKLLWSKNKQDDKEKEKEVQMESQWKSTQFAADQDGKITSKFRKLMGIKGNSEMNEEVQPELSEEQKRKQDELFSRLDKEYEFARMATHTHRGVGLGFSSQVQFPSTQPPH